MRTLLLALLVAPMATQSQSVSRADSALIGRLLLAEDRRDTTQDAYAAGLSHADPRIRRIAFRGMHRSRDAAFARRDSLSPAPASPRFANPAWRARFAALGRTNDNCAVLARALTDSAPQVRIRAADLAAALTPQEIVRPAPCGGDTAIIRVLKSWLPTLPTTANRQPRQPSWHAPAHAFVALARTSARNDLRAEMPRYVTSPIPGVRSYVVTAAAVMNDTAILRRLAADPDDNVKELAIVALRRIAGHSSDDAIAKALSSTGYQAVRAAAQALRGTPLRAEVLSAAISASVRIRRDSSETSRDARMALALLLADLAQPADWTRIATLTSDFDCLVADSIASLGRKLGNANATARCTKLPITLPPDAVRLALGADVRLRVTMADGSGGGTIIVKLRGDVAPLMAARVLDLARRGYYNGKPWHRVEHNFVVQGGGGGNEYVGFPRFFRDEVGNLSHMRGTIGMSTRGHDTGDAQWFFNLIDNTRLDREYTVFAEVTEGMDVVDGIFEGDVISRIEVIEAR
jgi:cyclophilin family peptidyl-prolyl cis-trans isomerase